MSSPAFDLKGERDQFGVRILRTLAQHLRIEAAHRSMDIRDVVEERLIRDIETHPFEPGQAAEAVTGEWEPASI